MDGRFRPHLVASLDMLGTSALFKNGEKDKMEEFIDTMEGFYNAISENMGTYKAKTFSDNVLLSTDDLSESNIVSFMTSVASLQFNTVCNMHVLIRGGISMDQLYIKDSDNGNDFVIGRALVNAYELESKTAVYPRVIVDEILVNQFKNNGWDDSMLVKKPRSDHSFVDYLQTTMSEGFPDRHKLRLHGSALVDHVNRDNDINDGDGLLRGKSWDAIRSKDVWALAYHNDFCSRVDADDCKVGFTERYRDGRVVIEFDSTEEGS